MSDYISKSALIEELYKSENQPTRDTDDFIEGYCEGWNDVVDIMKNQPTLDETEIIRKHEKHTMTFPTVDEYSKKVAEKALDEYEYEGKTIRQWVEVLKDYDDKKTTMERILSRLEEEKSDWNDDYNVPISKAIKIVKEEGGIE